MKFLETFVLIILMFIILSELSAKSKEEQIEKRQVEKQVYIDPDYEKMVETDIIADYMVCYAVRDQLNESQLEPDNMPPWLKACLEAMDKRCKADKNPRCAELKQKAAQIALALESL